MKTLDEIKQMMATGEAAEMDEALNDQMAQKPSPMLVVVETASATNAPARRIIRFVPKNGERR